MPKISKYALISVNLARITFLLPFLKLTLESQRIDFHAHNIKIRVHIGQFGSYDVFIAFFETHILNPKGLIYMPTISKYALISVNLARMTFLLPFWNSHLESKRIDFHAHNIKIRAHIGQFGSYDVFIAFFEIHMNIIILLALKR